MKQFSKELGKVSITPKGDWNSSIANEKLDIVYDRRNNQAYIAKQDVPIGVDIDNREYWQPLNVSGYADNNFINLTAENENGTITAYESLEEAVATIFPINRRVGATLSFYNLNSDRLDRQAEFELWQFNSTDLANWENKDYWNNIYYNWNVFAGWYIDADALKNHVETPNVGQYAYVGSNLNDAILYQCRTNGTWTNTGIKVRNYISVVVSGNITIGENGNWFSNGEDTGIPATPAVDEQLDNIITKHESLSRTVQGIAVTGGASTATNVTYNNDNSGLNAENAQDAIDELENKKLNKESIVQESGTAIDKIMSQGAIKTELDKFSDLVEKKDYVNNFLYNKQESLETFGNLVIDNIALKAEDDVHVRLIPLTNLNNNNSMRLVVNIYYSASGNIKYYTIIPEKYYELNKTIEGNFVLPKDCTFIKIQIASTNFGGNCKVEVFKSINVVNTLEEKIDKSSIAQGLGTALDKVMSQKAVSDKLNELSQNSSNLNNWNNKNVVWFGTSIPCGSNTEVSIDNYSGANQYPLMVGYLLGCNVYNEAVGGSKIAVSNSPTCYDINSNKLALDKDNKQSMFECYSSLGMTIAEKDYLYDNWANIYTAFSDGTPAPPVSKETMESYSFESKLIDKYIKENPSVINADLIIIEHGFNDRDNLLFDEYPEAYSQNERCFFKGALSYFIRKILEANSRAKILLGTMYSNYDQHYKVRDAIIDVAKRYAIPYIDYTDDLTVGNFNNIYARGYWDENRIWHETGFSWEEDANANNGYTTNMHGFLAGLSKDNWKNVLHVHNVTKDEDLANIYPIGTTVYRIGRIPILMYDNLHPHSDSSGEFNMRIAKYIAENIQNKIQF